LYHLDTVSQPIPEPRKKGFRRRGGGERAYGREAKIICGVRRYTEGLRRGTKGQNN
jgi:hypothetical protein